MLSGSSKASWARAWDTLFPFLYQCDSPYTSLIAYCHEQYSYVPTPKIQYDLDTDSIRLMVDALKATLTYKENKSYINISFIFGSTKHIK
jgi:hypothetical protein